MSSAEDGSLRTRLELETDLGVAITVQAREDKGLERGCRVGAGRRDPIQELLRRLKLQDLVGDWR